MKKSRIIGTCLSKLFLLGKEGKKRSVGMRGFLWLRRVASFLRDEQTNLIHTAGEETTLAKRVIQGRWFFYT